MKIYDVVELVLGTTVFLLTLVGCVVVSNKITHFFIPKTTKNINIFLLSLHLIVIVVFVMAIRSIFFKYIQNKDVLNSIFTLTGPIIGLSSLYMSNTLHALI